MDLENFYSFFSTHLRHFYGLSTSLISGYSHFTFSAITLPNVNFYLDIPQAALQDHQLCVMSRSVSQGERGVGIFLGSKNWRKLNIKKLKSCFNSRKSQSLLSSQVHCEPSRVVCIIHHVSHMFFYETHFSQNTQHPLGHKHFTKQSL